MYYNPGQTKFRVRRFGTQSYTEEAPRYTETKINKKSLRNSVCSLRISAQPKVATIKDNILPDWVTHLGTTYIAAHATRQLKPGLARWIDWRYLLLGALLPDATRFTIILVDVLDWPAIPTFTYLIPFHSLLIVVLLAGAIALLIPTGGTGSWHAFGLFVAGAALHFLLDDLEGPIGCGSTTFYPLYFGKPINAWNSEGHVGTLLMVVSAIALGMILGRQQQLPLLTFRFTRRRVIGAVGLLAATLIIPLFFRTWMIEQNAYFLGFVTNPAAFEGQTVELCFSEVVNTNPLTIEEFDTSFVVQAPPTYDLGEWVSVRGIYQDNAIWPTTLIRHQGFSDVTLSLVAAIVFIVLVFDRRYLRVFRH